MKKDDGIDRKIVSALEKLSQIYRVLLWDVAKKERLSPIQIQFLIYLRNYPGPMRKVSGLAKEFDLSKATVSEAVKSLEEKGMLSRSVERDDRRSSILIVTPKGRRVVNRVERWHDVLLERVSGFPRDVKAPALQFLMELIKSLYDQGIIQIARMCIACENFNREYKGRGSHYCRLTERVITDDDLSIGCDNFK